MDEYVNNVKNRKFKISSQTYGVPLEKPRIVLRSPTDANFDSNLWRRSHASLRRRLENENVYSLSTPELLAYATLQIDLCDPNWLHSIIDTKTSRGKHDAHNHYIN